MKEQSPPFETTTIAAEACAWIAQVESGKLTREDVKALQEWIHRSPRHAEELRRYAHLWNNLDILTEMAGPIEEALAPRQRLVSWPRFKALAPRLAMAFVALTVAVSAIVIVIDKGETPNGPLMVSTAIGEQRRVDMPDESAVNLNTNSQIEVDYDQGQRRIRLLKGEAFFDVAKEQRPFLVYAGNRIVRAVGTAFSVRLKPEAIEVTVAEGTVELAAMTEMDRRSSQSDQPAGSIRGRPLATVTAGQWALAGHDVLGHVETISREDLKRKLAWRSGELEFSGEPLTDIISEVSRYTPLKIVIRDPRLQEIKVGGIFRIGETEALFDALEESFDVKVEQTGDVVYLSATERG